MGVPPTINDFATREDLARSLAARVAGVLSAAIAASGTATLAVSGGTTPALFFRYLSQADIDWSNVVVTLVDERFVPDSSDRSNARLAKANLLTGAAAAARFLPLFSDADDVETAARRADAAIRALPLPFDAVILGMGNDGHTASFFPDAATLEDLTNPAADMLVAPVHAPSGGEPRLTLTLPPIVGAGLLVLHIEGEAKRKVLDSARAGTKLPIRAVLDHAPRPVEVFWAP